MTAPSPVPKPGVFRRLGPAGPVAVVLSFWPPVGGIFLLTFLTTLGPWLRDHAAIGVLTYFVVAGLLVGFSFLPTFTCAILAGWAFGFTVGWPLTVITITAASVLAYALGRWVARDRVVELIAEKPAWRTVHAALLGRHSGRALLVVALLRIPPASPFALGNFALAAARVPLRDYILGTFIGIAPRTAVTAFAAAKLEQLQFKNASDTWLVVTGLAVTLAACISLGVLANRALAHMGRSDSTAA